MVYINLIDYLDKPELIQSHDGRVIKALHYFPDNRHYERILVVFEDGRTYFFSEKGIYSDDKSRSFVLKPKPKKKITGWRKILHHKSDGSTGTDASWYPTKEQFLEAYKGCIFIGDWQHEEWEVDDE